MLNHKKIWEIFTEISKIPRCSGNEKAVAKWLEERAQKLGCKTCRDSVGNLIIKKAAAKGFENRKIITLQGHLDMVCEKEENSSHDFSCDPLILETVLIENKNGIKESWLTAKGTTLGADNGFALAAGMALLEDEDFQCGPLELIFTVDEEEGLKGAFDLDGSLVDGRILINLDSEDEGEFTIGCAGGKTLNFFSESFEKVQNSENKGENSFKIVFSGFLGGHSGVEIHRVKHNAINELILFLSQLNQEFGINLIEFESIFRHNVIPSSATAFFSTSTPILLLQEKIETFNANLKVLLPSAKLSICKFDDDYEFIFTKEASDRFLKLAGELPFGPFSFVAGADNLVESSANLAELVFNQNGVKGVISFRSSNGKKLEQLTSDYENKIKSFGCEVEFEGSYPSWQPDFNSDLLKQSVALWEQERGEKPKVSVIHAGLECGLIGEKLEGCQMISMGPDMVDVHSPKERMNMASAERVYDFVKALVLSDLSK